MKRQKTKKAWIAAVLIILSLSIVGGGIFAVNAKENSTTADQQTKPIQSTGISSDGDAEWLHQQIFYAMHHRGTWLYDLMKATLIAPTSDKSQPAEVFEEAYLRGIIGDYTEDDIHGPLDRRFIAQTTVRALGYEKKSIGKAADILPGDEDLLTLSYYSWFMPDSYNRLYPEALITPEEYDGLLAELNRCRQLRGKKLLSFGDSIMYGAGNYGEGLSDMIAQKYGMIVSDYAISGAAMGDSEGRAYIFDEITEAIAADKKADIILLNGGTNDINHTAFGDLQNGFDISGIDETSFTGGFEKTMSTLQKQWKNTPVVYVRVHNMGFFKDDVEQKYGERALLIAEKWGASTVDLYRRSGMNTENQIVSNRYTMKEPGSEISDSVHPTALGYAKFYLPPVGDTVAEQLISEE